MIGISRSSATARQPPRSTRSQDRPDARAALDIDQAPN